MLYIIGFIVETDGKMYRVWGIEYQWAITGPKGCVAPSVDVFEDGSRNSEQRLKEMELMIQVIADPSKAPLLAGVDWAGGLMSYLILEAEFDD